VWLKTETSAGSEPAVRGIHVERTGTRALVCATEPLDLAGAGHFLERARPLIRNCEVLIADLREAEFVDSAGIRALLTLAETLEADRKELRLVIRPESRVEHTLSLLQLLERFQCFPTLELACGKEPAIA